MHSRDRIEQHLTQQKARATAEAGPCRYRGVGGTMCAVGCLIRDSDYNLSTMEGKSVELMLNCNPGVLPTDISVNEMSAWQMYHDHEYDSSLDDGITPAVKFDYSEWIMGNEDHSPTKFKEYIAKIHGEKV